MPLNKEQSLARFHRKGNVLISAGAGSGKTTVLTQRVMDLIIDEHVPLSSLLILTFTNAAANHMKEKIRKALLGQNRFKEANDIDASFIMTFDAYALFLVKKYHHDLHLDARMDVIDPSFLDYYLKSNLDTIFTRYYEENTAFFERLIQRYVIKDDQTLKDFILKIYRHLDLKPSSSEFIATYVQTYFNESFIHRGLEKLEGYLLQQIEGLKHLSTFLEDSDEMGRILDTFQPLSEYDSLDDLITKILQTKIISTRGLSEEDKAIKASIRDDFNALKRYEALLPISMYIEAYRATQSDIEVILAILNELIMTMDEVKRSFKKFSFQDIAKFATRLLDLPHIQKEVTESLQYIMIDEYQDTNDIQEAFISKIASLNVFMVGDIKQSIYRFRHANSAIFSNKLSTFKPYHDSDASIDKVIHLNRNYRSRPEVLDSINSIFRPMMSVAYGGVNYIGDQVLQPGNDVYNALRDPEETYAIDHLAYTPSEFFAKEDEPYLIVQDILSRLEKKQLILDDNTQSLRPIMYRDIAILIDRKTSFDTYVDIFSKAGIPLQIYAERNVSSSDLYRLVKNVVLVLSYGPFNTVPSILKKPLMSILRSYVFNVDDVMIHSIITDQVAFTTTELFTILKPLYPLLQTLPLSLLFNHLNLAFKLESQLLRLEGLQDNLARLQAIHRLFNHATELGYTIHDFHHFLQTTSDLDIELTVAEGKSTDNAVTLMTIHKSKGLEFSFIYYPGLDKRFNFSDSRGYYHVDDTFGIQLPYPHLPFRYPLFKDILVEKEKNETISEYIRLFYVALTRAKEKMVLVYPTTKLKTIESVSKARSFLDLLSFSEVVDVNSTIPLVVHQVPTRSSHQGNSTTSITFDRLHLSFERYEPIRASKSQPVSIDKGALAFGNYLHECLFIVDFQTFDTQWMNDAHAKSILDTLFKLPLFESMKKNLKEGTISILKEYAYLNASGQKRIIDLCIKEGKTLTLVDYKTKRIDDPAYLKQLAIYAEDLTLLGYTIKSLNLVSILDATVMTADYPLSN